MAIDKDKLTQKDVGRWVNYCWHWSKEEFGRIKSWNDKWIFVVYHCDDKWNDFQNYTAAATHPNALNFIEKPKGIKL